MHCEFLIIVCHNGRKTFIIACCSKQNLLGVDCPFILHHVGMWTLHTNVKSGERCGYVQTGEIAKWHEDIELRKKEGKMNIPGLF